MVGACLSKSWQRVKLQCDAGSEEDGVKEKCRAVSEPNLFLLMVFSLQQMMRHEFWRSLKRLRQVRTALWSAILTGQWQRQTRRGCQIHGQWASQWCGQICEWVQGPTEKGCGYWVIGMQFVSLEFKLLKLKLKHLARDACYGWESRKYFVKEWGCENIHHRCHYCITKLLQRKTSRKLLKPSKIDAWLH